MANTIVSDLIHIIYFALSLSTYCAHTAVQFYLNVALFLDKRSAKYSFFDVISDEHFIKRDISSIVILNCGISNLEMKNHP